jgi:plastocyanin
LREPGQYQILDAFGDQGCCTSSSDTLHFVQKPHSVRVLKLIEKGRAQVPPAFEVQSVPGAKSGETVTFSAAASSSEAPVLTGHWDFGDGSSSEGTTVQHAFTHAGAYEVKTTVTGLDAVTNHKSTKIMISGDVSTQFKPMDKQRTE